MEARASTTSAADQAPHEVKSEAKLKAKFRVGDHVTWNSEAGHVSGRVVRIHTKEVSYKGYVHHASKTEPQYEIKSDKTKHIALHKASALKQLTSSSKRSQRKRSIRVYH
jgi:hypothetical protein